MMKKKLNLNENKNTNQYNNSYENSDEAKQSFFKKIKTDKKYKAKVELASYAILIVIIIIYLNISNLTNNYDYNNVSVNNTVDNKTEDVEKEKNLLQQLKDNYNYNIDIFLKITTNATEQNNNTNQNTTSNNQIPEIIEKKYNYNGKVYKNNLIINKNVDNNNIAYYKIDDEYYTKENETYNLTKEDTIYDLLDKKYIEFDMVKKYIEKANLDHFTTYSSGKKEYVYNLKISDVIQSYKENDLVEIDITIENDIITMNIDYTNLLKITDEKIFECKVTYTYKDINKIEEFTIIANENTNQQDKAYQQNDT